MHILRSVSMHSGDHLCACTEDCIMYVHARKRQFVHNREVNVHVKKGV